MAELFARFGDQMVLLLVIVVASVTAALAVHRQRRWAFGLAPSASCLAIGSALAIAALTLTRQTGAQYPGRSNTIPFHTMRGYLGDASDFAIYLCGNVAIFVPLGFFLYLALRRGPVLPAALTVLASCTVEVLQLPIWSRSSDVDDIILNSAGGVLGVLIAAGVARFVQPSTVSHTRPGMTDRGQHHGADDVPEQRMTTLLPMR